MIIRPARLSDFAHLETFVWQAIFPAFDRTGLTDEQRAENDALVENARSEVTGCLDREYYGVFAAVDLKTRTLAGYLITDARPRAYAEICRLIVHRKYHGKGVGELLLDEATEFIGRDRAVSLAVRYYNQRAIAFFSKHGFVNTGETTGNHAIPRTLMLREAHEVAAPTSAASATDEPVFEELPDYNLTTDDAPLFSTGSNALRTDEPEDTVPDDSSLSEDQLSVLEAFIAKARAQKQAAKAEHLPSAREVRKDPRADITFEVDYGNRVPPPHASPSASRSTFASAPATKPGPSFSFAFAPVVSSDAKRSPTVEAGSAAKPLVTEVPVPVAEATASVTAKAVEEEADGGRQKKIKACPDCSTDLPTAARFCFVCGMPQPVIEPPFAPAGGGPVTEAPDLIEALQLEELPPLPDDTADSSPGSTASSGPELPRAASVDAPDRPSPTEQGRSPLRDVEIGDCTDERTDDPAERTPAPVSRSELRQNFRKHLQDRIVAYFGDRKLRRYVARLEEDTAFQQVRDGSLSNLFRWLQRQPAADLARVRCRNTFADLTEYFVVETAGDLSGNVLPQRLLRHQSADWQTADLFKLVMDYLDFNAQAETIHTDFVSMPPRALRNATKSFLYAAKDERVFFICDQSLISRARNGFAITDAGIYWKNVLQPAGAATFTTMREPRLEQGHVVIDGLFFDAGGQLNLKVAVLLDKLRRMR